MKILQNILSPIFILVGIINLSEGKILTGALMSAFGLALLPLIFKLLEKKLRTHFKKGGKLIIRFSLFFLASYSNGNDLKNQRFVIEEQVAETISSYHETLENAKKIPLDSSLVRLDKIEADLRMYKKILPREGIKLLAELEDFSSPHFLNKAIAGLAEGDLARLKKDEYFREFFQNGTLNWLFKEQLAREIKEEKDFIKTQDYYLYRADMALKRGDWENYELHLKAAVELTAADKVPLSYLRKLTEKCRGNTAAFVSSSLLLLQEYPENIDQLLEIADTYLAQENYRKARKYYQKYLKKDAENIKALTHMGLCELKLNNKTKARQYLKTAMKYEGKGGQACELLSELSYKVVDYRYYSLCCDGSSSGSTGRGACSHHGGVCQKMKEPIKQKTLICN